MPSNVSSSKRRELDSIYHRVLKFLYDMAKAEPGREFAAREITGKIGLPTSTQQGVPTAEESHVGNYLRRALRQGLIEWNGLGHPRRKYFITPVQLPGAEERLAMFEAAEKPLTERDENVPAIIQTKSDAPLQRRQARRW